MEKYLENLKTEWLNEENSDFSGWDFSHIEPHRMRSEPLFWDYRAMAKSLLRPEQELLDMGTGGGELLESLGHPYERTSVTEGWDVNLELCRKRLAPKGVRVERWSDPPERLPFADESFDVVLNSHESYGIDEVRRVLKPGGIFLTEQVGGENSAPLRAFLLPERSANLAHSDADDAGFVFDLTHERESVEQAGFEVLAAAEQYPKSKFFDVGAIVWYCRIVVWEFPGFSVEKCFDKLAELQKRLERDGYIANREHRFMLMLRKL